MGYFGTGISENDTYLDVYTEFVTLYNKGKNIVDISKHLIETNSDYINDTSSPDFSSFWFALANAQWERKELNPDVYREVKKIIENNFDLQFWDGSDRQKRKKSLIKFLNKLSTERAKAKSRTKSKSPLFRKGDCLTFKLSNGNYGGVIILEVSLDEESDLELSLAAATRINSPTKPSLNDFVNSEVLITNFQFDNDKQAFQIIDWLFPYKPSKLKQIIEVIGQIEVVYRFSPSKNYGSSTGSFQWFTNVANDVPLQYKSEKIKPRYKDIKTIKELTQSDSWRYW
ncbi:MAG TPA: hypothetical protein PLP23_00375 [Panacibacter sp.]|nr:hypothetical protein [Panacibacter sp.]